jgi:hypothetical protein
MDPDEIVVNLKLLRLVGKHQKLITRDSFLNIEAKSLVPECVRRWRRGDDRHNAIVKINVIVAGAMELSPTIPIMRTYLQGAVDGIENLKETYEACSQTCARLDAILDKINAFLKTSASLEFKG